jgi:hypothetical protein
MKTFPGYPLQLGGTQKYVKKNLSLKDGSLELKEGDLAFVAGADALGQYIEQAILKAKATDGASAEVAMKGFFATSGYGVHFQEVTAFRSDDAVVEIDFIAVGYPAKSITVKLRS